MDYYNVDKPETEIANSSYDADRRFLCDGAGRDTSCDFGYCEVFPVFEYFRFSGTSGCQYFRFQQVRLRVRGLACRRRRYGRADDRGRVGTSDTQPGVVEEHTHRLKLTVWTKSSKPRRVRRLAELMLQRSRVEILSKVVDAGCRAARRGRPTWSSASQPCCRSWFSRC